MDDRESPLSRPRAPLWPVPAGSPATRLLRYTGAALTVALEVVTGGYVGIPRWLPRPLPNRLRELDRGKTITFEAKVIGSSAWCPRFPDLWAIDLTRHSAVATLGRNREIPLAQLAPVALHTPGNRPQLATALGGFWILALDGPGGQGSIAARIDDLALLAAVAGWPPPPELAGRPR